MREWTEERNAELRALYKIKTGPELAAHFGRSVRAVYMQAHKIGLRKPQPNKIELTEERRVWLRCHFPHMSNEICSLISGVSPRTVVRWARRMGLSKTAQRDLSGERVLLAEPAEGSKISIQKETLNNQLNRD